MNAPSSLSEKPPSHWLWLMAGLAVLLGGLVVGAAWRLGTPRDSTDSGDSNNKLVQAKKQLSDGRLDLAEAALLAHLQRFPQSAEALEELRWLYFNQFRTREIETFLEAHLARFPEDFGAAIELLNCEFRKQLPREGIGYLLAIDQKQPGQASVQLALGYCHWQIGELDAARTALQAALSQRPEHRETRFLVAEFLLENGETEAAANLLQEAADSKTNKHVSAAVADANDDRALFLRSLIAEQQGNVEMAYQAIQQAVTKRPGELPYVHREGLLLQRLGRQEEATRTLQRANQLEGFQSELSEIVLRGRHSEPTPEVCERLAQLLHEFAREIPSRSWRNLGSKLSATNSERRP